MPQECREKEEFRLDEEPNKQDKHAQISPRLRGGEGGQITLKRF